MWQLPEIAPDEMLMYLRKSQTDDPTLEVEEVLAKHEQMLNTWVEKNLPELGPVPEENRHREVVSGETIADRIQMKELLRRIESPKIKAVLVVEPQRLSRGDLEDIGRLVKLLRYSNTIVITLQYIYDLRDERDRDLFERELKRGNEFLEYTKRILHNGRLASLQAGNFVGNRAPYGYRIITVKDGKKTCYILEPHPDEAPVVKQIFDLYLQGLGVERIIDRLHELAIRPPSGEGERWAATTIRTMLSNEHYIGKVRWFHKKTVKTVQDGEVIARRPIAEDYLIYPGKHEAIISEEVFNAVQAKRGSLPRNKKAGNFSNIFAGMLYCECGKAMKRHAFVVKGVERAAPRLQCSQPKLCSNASCTVADLTQAVAQVLREALDDFEVRVEAGEDDSLEIHRQMVARLERRQEELAALEVSQWEKYTMEGMPKHIFDQLNTKVLAEKEEVQQALCTAKEAIPEPIDLETKVITFRAALDILADPKAPAKEVNELLKACIERITYRRPKAQGISSRWQTGAPIELDVKLRV
jgi:DNA invertase Pin-like site-specific DNA recombinase